VIRPLACFLGLLATALPAVRAQAQADPPPPKVIEIRPMAAPVPALKYRLLPERRDLIVGNAAVFYHRAIEMVQGVRMGQLTQALATKQSPADLAKVGETIQQWSSGPLREIPREEARKHLETYRNALHEVELGARRETCDWEFDRRQEGFSLLLSDIQESRTLGRLVALQVRFEILEGRPEGAIHWLETGFALARHVARGTTLVQSLVGMAITGQMFVVLEELIQAPGTPNLTWALAGFPRPMIDLTPALEGEFYMLEREFPRLKDLDSEPWSLDQARSFSREMQRELAKLTGMWTPVEAGSDLTMKDWGSQLSFTAMVARGYPEAKRSLIARGRPASQVEAMPAIQAVALSSYRRYEEIRDELFKWANVPYAQARRGLDEAARRISACQQDKYQGIPFVAVLPAIRSVFVAQIRTDRQLEVIQCIEAIRLYAAAHGGALPPSLEAISEAPAPLDSATGKPFEYKVGDDSAMLTAPIFPGAPNHPAFEIRYELKPVR